MTDDRQRQPAVDEAPHAIPKDAAVLAAPRQRAVPEPPHLEPKNPQRVLVQGHSVIPNVPTYHRLQPFALVGDGFAHATLKLGFHSHSASSAVSCGISRFPREVSRYVHGVSDR